MGTGVSVGVNTDMVGSVARGVCVGAGTSVCVAGWGAVRVATGVHVDDGVGISVGGKIREAADRPNTPEETLNTNKRKATTNHCCPASVRARRVR